MIREGHTEQIQDLLKRGRGRVHMMGIGGVGMSGLAYLLKKRGFEVDGCDRACGPLCHWLVEQGIQVLPEHNESHADDEYDLLVFTPAVDMYDRELQAFRKHGILEARRGEVLPLLLRGSTSVAVAGTHGKTTTATFIAHILKSCGLSVGWCIGGSAPSPGGVAGIPDRCDVLVVEADESDGTLRNYSPDIAVLTNVEYDHMEHFDSAEDFEECFSQFAARTRQRVVYCADDAIARKVGSGVETGISFGMTEGCGLRVTDIELDLGGSNFSVSGYGFEAERIHLPCPGIHNIMNAAASIVVAMELGGDIEAVRAALATARLPERRYQKVVTGDYTVISDYAHHPTEIKALIHTAILEAPAGVRAVFQPHRYTRTKALGADFATAFRGLDELVLAPVYAASEPPLRGGASHDLYVKLRDAEVVPSLIYSRSLASAWEYFRKTLQPDDTLLVIGAGDVEQIAYWLGRDVDEKRTEQISALYSEIEKLAPDANARREYPLGSRTMFGTGGTADLYMEVAAEKDISEIWQFCSRNGIRIHMFGAGGNTLVSDLGVRGVTLRMTGGDFDSIKIEDEIVSAGAAVTIPKLLDALEEAGLSGLEFLQGMPGTLGGVVHMNAGAYGSEVGEFLERIVCLKADGAQVELLKEDIEYGYRSMTCLQGRIVLRVDIRCRKSTPGEVAEKRSEVLEKRKWMLGKRSVGSVFKNPPDESAGMLIERAKLKGFKVGGVTVSNEHANVFVNDGTGTSSDMLCLIDLAAAEVRSEFGTILEREVVVLE